MISKIINWAIFIGIVYFLYSYFSTGDVTLAPPTKTQVTQLAIGANKQKLGPRERLMAGDKCKRAGGGWIKQSVFACPVNLFEGHDMYGKPKKSYTINVSKRNGKWYVRN